jgi:hypothetical protein
MVGQIVLASCFFLGSLILATALGFLTWRVWALHRFLIATSDRVDPTTLPKLAEIVEKYHAGVIAMGETQVTATKDLETAISRFGDLMFADTNGKGVQEYDDRKADAEYEVQNLMRNHHIPEDEARARVGERRLYDRMKVT